MESQLKLDAFVARLLEKHDCVIVPDFGGFVANYASASINPVNHRFDPPFRKITFNKFLVHNDGLLGAYLAQKRNEDYEVSVGFIKDYVIYLNKELKAKERVAIENVGVIYKQVDGSLRFEQVKNPEHFREGLGLESFFSHKVKPSETVVESIKLEPADEPSEELKNEPVVIPLPVQEEEDASKPAEDEPVAQPIQRRRIWPAIAAAVSVPLVGYAVWIALSTPLLKDSSQFHTSDLNPFVPKVCPEYSARESAFSPEKTEAPKTLIIPENSKTMELPLESNPDKTLVVRLSDPVEKMESISSADLKYHIIGGCFGVKSNAVGLAESYKLRGTNAGIIDKKGILYRVSIESFRTKKEAQLALASYKNEIEGAWLLYK